MAGVFNQLWTPVTSSIHLDRESVFLVLFISVCISVFLGHLFMYFCFCFCVYFNKVCENLWSPVYILIKSFSLWVLCIYLQLWKLAMIAFGTRRSNTGCLKKNWVLPNWAFADPASNWGEILNDFCGKSSCIMLWVGNFNAFIGRFADTALGAYRVWKGALKNKRLHKNKWFLKIIQTGINPTTPDLIGSTGFVTKNHKYFSPTTSRICKCFIWQNSFF